MQYEKFHVSGDRLELKHDAPLLETYNFPIGNLSQESGLVRIFHYADDTVVVQIIHPNKQPDVWVNRAFEFDPQTNTVRILPRNQ